MHHSRFQANPHHHNLCPSCFFFGVGDNQILFFSVSHGPGSGANGELPVRGPI